MMFDRWIAVCPFSAQLHVCQFSGSRGRPAVNINTAQLALMQKSGFTAVEMADHLGCSAYVIYKKNGPMPVFKCVTDMPIFQTNS